MPNYDQFNQPPVSPQFNRPPMTPAMPMGGMRETNIGAGEYMRSHEMMAPAMRCAQQYGMARREDIDCNLPLAMAWFEYQRYGSVYNPEQAMNRGTLFPELDKPWLAPQGGH